MMMMPHLRLPAVCLRLPVCSNRHRCRGLQQLDTILPRSILHCLNPVLVPPANVKDGFLYLLQDRERSAGTTAAT